MTKRRRTLPPVSPRLPAELRPLISAMTEILETGEGVRGDPLDRKVTLRDLVDSGIGKMKGGARPGAGGGLMPGVEPPAPDLSTPPPPQGFAADGSFYGMIILSWQIPSELYRNHAYTNIYRSEEDNYANAEIVGREIGAFYSDFVRNDALDPDDPTLLKGYYYWISFSSVAGVEGPPNAGAGTFARPIADVGYVIELLTGQIDETLLAESLRQPIERIDVLDGAETLEGSVAYRVAQERDARIAGDEALASDIAALTAVEDQNAADIVSESQARANAVEAVASDVTALYAATEALEGEILDEARVRATEDDLLAGVQRVISAAGEVQAASLYTLSQIRISENEVLVQETSGLEGRLGDAEGAIQNESTIRLQENQALAQQITTLQEQIDEDFAAVQTTLSANVERIDGELVALGASYTAQVQANGLIGGFSVYNDGTTVDAAFNVDRFWIGRSQADKRNPFVVVNGVVYIDTAMIRDASIQEGKIGPITVGKLRRPDGTPVTTVAGLVRADAIDVDALRIGFGQVSGDLQSTAVGSNGQPLWRLQRNGGFSLNSAGTGGRMEQTADRISVFDGSGRLRVRIGRL